jgi:hypothetical protein
MVAGFHALKGDLSKISTAAVHHDAASTEAATRALLTDAAIEKTADVARSEQLGLQRPATSTASRAQPLSAGAHPSPRAPGVLLINFIWCYLCRGIMNVDIHQHVWTGPLLDALAARRCLPFVSAPMAHRAARRRRLHTSSTPPPSRRGGVQLLRADEVDGRGGAVGRSGSRRSQRRRRAISAHLDGVLALGEGFGGRFPSAPGQPASMRSWRGAASACRCRRARCRAATPWPHGPGARARAVPWGPSLRASGAWPAARPARRRSPSPCGGAP